jgi:hypothetical protein
VAQCCCSARSSDLGGDAGDSVEPQDKQPTHTSEEVAMKKFLEVACFVLALMSLSGCIVEDGGGWHHGGGWEHGDHYH